MLTRLQVKGFKNLVDVDVRFGPFTCIAGANGVGKSNLLDAILFLSALADKSLVEAALSVRDEGGRTGDVRSLFHRLGADQTNEMSLEAEMIVSARGTDDLGQEAEATRTFLRYRVDLALRSEESPSLGAIELRKERLHYVSKGETNQSLLFPNSKEWRESVVKGDRRVAYISTSDEGSIQVHQDGGSSGKPHKMLARNLPRTALSAASAAESPTALLARREMQSWRLLQLEPSALREPDEFSAQTQLAANGAHLPATLYYLANHNGSGQGSHHEKARIEAQVYSRVGNRLAELIDDVLDVRVDRDPRRELMTLYVKGRDGTAHPARALSDGTLRFLALAVLELDPRANGLICLEEPENGIHPDRIPAILRLLSDVVTDTSQPVDGENPLRQMIVNTHSPEVVAQVADEDLLIAGHSKYTRDGKAFRGLTFGCLPRTWRAKAGGPVIARGALLPYLGPFLSHDEDVHWQRVVDRKDLQLLLPFGESG